MNKHLKKVLIFIFWIAIWTGLALIVANPVVLSSPLDVFASISENISNSEFWLTILICFFRISLGFIAACVIGSLLAIFSFLFKTFKDFIEPLIQLLKSAPIVCFIVLLLIWVGSQFVDIVTVILAVVPIFYYAIYQACKNRDKNILNMLKVFKVSKSVKWRVYDWPSAFPYFKQAAQSGIGIAWKSGVTAQMIGAVGLTIGDKIFTSKLYLDSAQVLLWMFIVILLGWISEKIILLMINKFTNLGQKNQNKKSYNNDDEQEWNLDNQARLVIANINKTFDNKQVLNNYTQNLEAAQRYGLDWNTGSGKSSLINIITGLIKPDSGEIFVKDYKPRTFSVCFQENTLLNNLSVNQNLQLVSSKSIKSQLINGNLMIDELSGGMKRLVQIERAIIAKSQIVILDEPFTGLDEETKTKAIEYINNNLNNRILIISSHDTKDLKALKCEMI